MHNAYLPRKSKRGMLSALGRTDVTASKFPRRNTLDYTTADGTRRLRLHDTDVVTVAPNGGITLDTGGFNTPLTRERINDFLPRVRPGYTVYQNALSTPNGARIIFDRTVYIGPRGAVRPDDQTLPARKQRALDTYCKALPVVFRLCGGVPPEDINWNPRIDSDTSRTDAATMLEWITCGRAPALMVETALLRRYAAHAIYHFLPRPDKEGGRLGREALRQVRRYARSCLGLPT